jgi:hypothetical protein
MKELTITQNMYNSAEGMANEQGVLKGSIRFGAGNIYGFLGEELFHKCYPEAIRENTMDYDFIYHNLHIDVKTKMTTVKPLMEYEGSVTKMPKHQACDIYFFCRVHKDTRKGWVIGWEYTDRFFEKAYLKNKGDKDPSNGNVCKRACWNIFYRDLKPLIELEEAWLNQKC